MISFQEGDYIIYNKKVYTITKVRKDQRVNIKGVYNKKHETPFITHIQLIIIDSHNVHSYIKGIKSENISNLFTIKEAKFPQRIIHLKFNSQSQVKIGCLCPDSYSYLKYIKINAKLNEINEAINFFKNLINNPDFEEWVNRPWERQEQTIQNAQYIHYGHV